jgi:hypothetical protein
MTTLKLRTVRGFGYTFAVPPDAADGESELGWSCQ